MKNIGRCLCNKVIFGVNQQIQVIYHCHCSLCRKQSGTSCNSATLVGLDQFEWLSGEQCIQSYRIESGFKSSFCLTCGSPLPNRVGNSNFMWIPLGLLDNEIEPVRRLNFCIASKVSWSQDLESDHDYSALPTWDQLQQYFK